MKVPQGHPGSWFAKWEGESLPCIHQHAIKSGVYVDDGVDSHSAWPRFISELQRLKRAIVTTSHPPDANGLRRRDKYVGIWEIGDLEIIQPTEAEKGTLTFPLIAPLLRFRK